jgi:hypothetical protein
VTGRCGRKRCRGGYSNRSDALLRQHLRDKYPSP